MGGPVRQPVGVRRLAARRRRQPGDVAVLTCSDPPRLTNGCPLTSSTAADGLALPAVPDPGIARIVKMLRGRPPARWSVDAMARSAGMSRTLFTTRFRATIGEPPMAYVTDLRLRRAAGYLSTTTKSVREIAHPTGYGNEASFSKAFSRLSGRPPGEYRRQRLPAPQQTPLTPAESVAVHNDQF
jgi:transcriptional regulator GlxA family with amidase domain